MTQRKRKKKSAVPFGEEPVYHAEDFGLDSKDSGEPGQDFK